MSTTDTPDFSVHVGMILSDLRRDQEASVVLRRDVDLCKRDVETRAGTGALDLQKTYQENLEFYTYHRGNYLQSIDACLEMRSVECDALTVRDMINDAEHDADMLEKIELLFTLKRRWSCMRDNIAVQINTEKERIKHEKVGIERFDEELYSTYTERIETVSRKLKRLESDVATAWAEVNEGARRLAKRRRTAIDMANDNTEFSVISATESISHANFSRMDINITLQAEYYSLICRARKFQDMLYVMQRSVMSFKRRDKRGLYKNIVYTNARYRWKYFHCNRLYSSRGSFHTIEEAMVSLIDDKSDRMV